MEHATKRAKASKRKVSGPKKISPREFLRMGAGSVGYIRMLSPEKALALYPAIKGLPKGIDLFALHAADGRPIALTDSFDAAKGHAMGDKLEVCGLH